MEFLRLLRSESDRDTTRLLLIAVFSGLMSTLLVALIIASARSIYPGRLDLLNLSKFVLCLAAYVVSRRYVQLQTSTLAERIMMKTRLRVLDKIRRSNLLQYERVRRAQVTTVLTESTLTLSTSAGFIATGFSSGVMLVCATLYVAYLSMRAFLLIAGLMVAGCILYSSIRKKLELQLQKSNAKESEFFDLTNHLLDGFKEVKMNQGRSDDLYENYLSKIAEEARQLKISTMQYIVSVSVVGQNFLYVLLAFLIFVFPAFGDKDIQNMSQIATAIIFIMGPLGEVVAAVPLITRSNSAIRIIEELEGNLNSGEIDGDEANSATLAKFRSFHEISLRGILFAYENQPVTARFQLGPVDLNVRANELLFIVGGNGTGKSTLLKVMTGLYKGQAGNIMVDDDIVSNRDLPAYRSLFSIIFTDFHLFDRLYGFRDLDKEAVDKLVVEMRLQDVTGVENGRFQRIDLSTGQKKRLALIVALLEQRPILVFDEVAADQDPAFRRYFYEALLPRLRSEGKTIVAVTHDDHYFHVADRTLKMEDGKFVEFTT